MSVALPVCSLVFGTVTPPQSDVIELRVHLGCTKEVGSFDCLLQNFDKKYSPGGTYPINVGDDGRIYIGRGANNPLIAHIIVEEIKALSDPRGENYLRVSGRCWGERLFRRVVTKTYENKKGEEIVKDLIDYYVGLSHVRDTTELIENTDTTYTKLEYENTPVFDVLKYIAETADKAGVIGFDFRVAPDGKFEFFPRNSKTSNVSLSERLEVSEYRKSAFRKRDRIYVYGAAEKKYPSDGDSWTETLDINNDTINDWVSGTGTGSVSRDTVVKAVGAASIKHTTGIPDYYGRLRLIIPSGWQPNLNKYPTLQFQIRREAAFSGACTVILQDNAGKWASREFQISADKWIIQKFMVGKKYADEWQGSAVQDGTFNWEIINEIMWDVHFSGTGTGSFWVDNLYFNAARWSATYGTGSRELTETDEELHSDNECLLRAKALYDHLSSPAEYIRVTSDVIDYGTTPILAGDRIWVTLPNENVDGYYRVISVEYRLIAEIQTLEITLELGKEPPLLADYLYGLRATTVTVEKLARTKLGKDFGGAAGGGGGVGGHTHAAGDVISGVFAEARIPDVFTLMRYFYGGITMGAALNMNWQSIQYLDRVNQCMPPSPNSGWVGDTTTYWYAIAGNSVWYKALGQFACAKELSDKLVAELDHPFIKFRDVAKAVKFIEHEIRKEWRHIPYAEDGKLKCPICGKLNQDFCDEHREQMEDRYMVKTGDLIFAIANLVLDLTAKVEALEKQLEKPKGAS